jgi:membrane-associated phospholipid phosphatase
VTTRGQRSPAGTPWRGVWAGVLVAVATVLSGVVATDAVGLHLRDPDHVAALYLALVGLGVLVLAAIDVAVRARPRSRGRWPTPAALGAVRRERWTLGRSVAVGGALVAFYATYMAYRNLKSIVPLVRPGDLFDRQLADVDRSLFAGHDPAALLHALPGTGVTTQILSAFYVAFIVFLPLTIGAALVFATDLRPALFYVTTQSVNWVLGAASYFLLPSLGPIYFDPAAFSDLPASEVTRLQAVLLDQRLDFLRDPATGTPQSIAAFASLHISMSFAAAVAAHLLGLGRRLRIALWVWFAVTAVGTVYLGWHYVVDDIAGVLMGAIALALARALTAIDLRGARRGRTSTVVLPRARPSGPRAPTILDPVARYRQRINESRHQP